MFCLEKLIIYLLDTHEISEIRSSININVYNCMYLTLTLHIHSHFLFKKSIEREKKSMLNVLFCYLQRTQLILTHTHAIMYIKTIQMMFIKFYALFFFSSSHISAFLCFLLLYYNTNFFVFVVDDVNTYGWGWEPRIWHHTITPTQNTNRWHSSRYVV